MFGVVRLCVRIRAVAVSTFKSVSVFPCSKHVLFCFVLYCIQIWLVVPVLANATCTKSALRVSIRIPVTE